MRWEALWTVAPVVLFLGLPIYLVSIEPADTPTESLLNAAVVILAAVFVVPAAIFIVVALVRGLLPVGAARRVRDVERTQAFTALGYGCLVTALTLAMATTYPAVAGIYAALILAWAFWNIPPSARRVDYRLRSIARSSPDEAFALVSDPRNWHRYLPELDVFGPLDLPLHLGSIVHTISRQGRFALSEEEQVVAYEPGRRFGTASVHRRPTDGVYEMSRLDEGTEIIWTYWTVLTYPQAVLGGPFGRRSLLARITERRQKSLETIRRLLEAPAPVPV